MRLTSQTPEVRVQGGKAVLEQTGYRVTHIPEAAVGSPGEPPAACSGTGSVALGCWTALKTSAVFSGRTRKPRCTATARAARSE